MKPLYASRASSPRRSNLAKIAVSGSFWEITALRRQWWRRRWRWRRPAAGSCRRRCHPFRPWRIRPSTRRCAWLARSRHRRAGRPPRHRPCLQQGGNVDPRSTMLPPCRRRGSCAGGHEADCECHAPASWRCWRRDANRPACGWDRVRRLQSIGVARHRGRHPNCRTRQEDRVPRLARRAASCLQRSKSSSRPALSRIHGSGHSAMAAAFPNPFCNAAGRGIALKLHIPTGGRAKLRYNALPQPLPGEEYTHEGDH